MCQQGKDEKERNEQAHRQLRDVAGRHRRPAPPVEQGNQVEHAVALQRAVQQELSNRALPRHHYQVPPLLLR